MKKVGIITINDTHNYGNRLQNYAVQRFIEKYQLEVENIVDDTYYNNLNTGAVGKIKLALKDILLKNSKNKIRYDNFMLFNKKIKYSNYVVNNKRFNEDINEEYDFFVVGSDQVWNPNFAISDVMLLKRFKNTKVAFSASFGVERISEKLKDYYKENLEKIDYISVREDTGKKITKELTCREDVEVLVDPTMLLSAEEWDEIAAKPEGLAADKFILNYFLGELSQERRNEINKIAEENGCQVINILDKEDPMFVSGPGEFLWLEKNAFLICTDSFHSSVFAILYNRPFIVFDREDKEEKMSSRIETLIAKFCLENRQYNGSCITRENLEHDYSNAYEVLEQERQKSDDFLRKALKIEE